MSKSGAFSLPGEDLEMVARNAANDLRFLKKAHVFLTGGTSFFGKWLVESLLWADRELDLQMKITALSRNPKAFIASMPHLANFPALEMLQGDVETFRFQDLSAFSHVIHGATLPNDGSLQWPLSAMDSALEGARRVIAAAGYFGCARVLYLSSGAAFRAELGTPGTDINQPCVEIQNSAADSLSEPQVYGLTKKFIETYLAASGTVKNMEIPLARCFTFAGPYMPLGNNQAFGNFVRDALAHKDIIIKGDGSAVRSYMHAGELVVWLVALLVRGRHGVPYNVGSEEKVSILELAEKIAAVGGGSKVVVQGRQVQGNAPSMYVPDTRRIRTELGVGCTLPLDAVVAKTMDWFGKIPHSCR